MSKLIVLLVAVAAVWGLPSGVSEIRDRTRIIGSRNANIANHPHQLQLLEQQIPSGILGFFCGAVMIGSKWALTAAHCTDPVRQRNSLHLLYVAAGTDNLYTASECIHVANVYQNPRFVPKTFDYDISVLELIHHITTPIARPIPLHDSGYVAEEGTLATATGWGLMDKRNTRYPDRLKVVVDKIVGNEICSQKHRRYNDIITDRMACAGDMETGAENLCHGDSGGPLVVHEKLYGITTGVNSCDTPDTPAVFCRISEESIREFIRLITGI